MKDYHSLIDNTVQIDETNLPSGLKNVISELKKYDNQKEDIMYDGLAGTFEAGCKECLLNNQINTRQYNLLMKKYRSYLL